MNAWRSRSNDNNDNYYDDVDVVGDIGHVVNNEEDKNGENNGDKERKKSKIKSKNDNRNKNENKNEYKNENEYEIENENKNEHENKNENENKTKRNECLRELITVKGKRRLLLYYFPSYLLAMYVFLRRNNASPSISENNNQ